MGHELSGDLPAPPLDGGLTPVAQRWRIGIQDGTPMCARFLLLVVLLAPHPAGAQAAPARRALGLDSLPFAELQRLVAAQASVRVRRGMADVVVLRPTLTTDSLLGAATRAGAPGRRLGLGDVTRIQVRGRASGTGALVGALVGFAGGLAAGLGASASLCGDGLGCGNAGGGTAVVTLASTGLGALLGALIGATIGRWRTVFAVP
jgi:hypothetical protein